MTCHEVRLYFEDPLRFDADFTGEAEHLARCPECARFVEARRELRAGLHLLRDSVPQAPATLDAAVLTSYRRQIANGATGVRRASRKSRIVLAWGAAAALIALAASIAVYSSRENERRSAQIAVQKITVAESNAANAANGLSSTKPALSKTKIVPSKKALRPHPAHAEHSASTMATADNRAPEMFRSLMYCDPLSCGESMQVIRVQLPSSAAFDPAATAAGEAIYADVLVGPDGVARGIHVLQ